MKISEAYQNSITAKSLKMLNVIYSNSVLALFARKFAVIFKSSILYGIYKNHIERRPTHRESFTFKVIRKAGLFFDRAAGKFHDNAAVIIRNSMPGKVIALIREDPKNPGILIACAAAGYLAGIVLLGKWSTYSLIVLALLVIISVAAFSIGKIEIWYKNSLLNKLISFLFESDSHEINE